MRFIFITAVVVFAFFISVQVARPSIEKAMDLKVTKELHINNIK